VSLELEDLGIDIRYIDKTYSGKKIDVEFNGTLRDGQSLALEQLLCHDNGILSGTTAFGKTIVAIKLIAEKKLNTLILVDKILHHSHLIPYLFDRSDQSLKKTETNSNNTEL